MRQRCDHCGAMLPPPIQMLGGETDLTCLICSRPYLTPREIADRDQYLARVNTPRSRREPVTPTYREGSWTDRHY
jgi:hypothetical protein